MNMVSHRAANAYQRARDCAPQPWMMVMLLKGVNDHLIKARNAFTSGHRGECATCIGKAMSILQGLRKNLRPEIAARLTGLLDRFYVANLLLISNLMRNGFDEAVFARIKKNMEIMQDAWASLQDLEDSDD